MLLYAALAGLLIGLAFVYYRHEQARLRAESIQNLQAIADFKRNQLEEWITRQEHLVRLWERGSMVSELAGRWMAAGRLHERDLNWLRERLEMARASLEAESVSFIDFTGALRLQTTPHPMPSDVAELTSEVINRNQLRWIDFYSRENPRGASIHLDLMVPLYSRTSARAIGALLFHFDPADFLFPLIQKWPTASATAESLLVRREGERMLYLNELRHRAGTALRLSMPLSATEVPAVQAARGISGRVQGKDYRGEPVQAVITSITGTPWKLIAKMDHQEIDASMQREAIRLFLVVIALLLSFAFITRLWWRRQYLEQAACYWESETQRRLLTRRLDYLARYAHDIILLVGADGRLVDVNDRALSTYGYARDQLIGRPVRELRPAPLQANQTEQMLRSASQEGMVYEAVHRKKDGETFPVEVSARRIDEGGERFVQEIVRDISERKQAERQLRLMSFAMEHVREAAYLIRRDGRFPYVNKEACRLLGYSKEELLSLGIQDVRPDHTPESWETYWQSLQTSGSVMVETQHRAKDGRMIAVEVSANFFEYEGEAYDLALARDIRERKRLEQALRDSEARLRLALRAAQMGIFDWDFRTGVNVFTPELEALYGLAPGTFAGTQMAWEALLHPDDREAAMRSIGEAFDTGEPIEHEFRVVWPDGSVHWLVGRWQVLKGSDGEPQHLTGVTFDVTARKAAEAQLRLAARVFEGSREGILVTDAALRIVAINPAFTEITGYAAAEVIGRNPGLLNSGRQDPAFYQALWETVKQSGSWEGEIWNRRKDGSIFPEWLTISTVTDSQGQPLNYVGFFTDITERKAAQERLEFLAHHDPLTELPNRALLLDRIDTALAGARRARERIGVLFVDLDRFKLINDSLGHLVGDQVLCAIAERLQQCLRAEDTLSRIGGDEFVALLNGIHEAGDAARVAEKILDSLKEPLTIADHPLTVSPSIGIALQDDGADAERLIQKADAAMYRAKSAGRNTYSFFTPDLNDQAIQRLSLENDLRTALERDQFEAHYQPQLDGADGRLIGFEALIRWLHPRQGLTLPKQFIPVAEDTGLILPIGERVLDIAGRQLAHWRRTGLSPETIAVNLSAKQFRCPKLADRLRAILDRHEVSPRCIELELTESALMDPEHALSTIQDLKAAGFRLTLDDFGIGYSNLNYLRRYAFDTLKIDQSFISDLPSDRQDAAIVKAILNVADAIGCLVIAEGVETQAQLDFLVAHGCHRYQGFLACQPLPAQETDRFLAKVNIGQADFGVRAASA